MSSGSDETCGWIYSIARNAVIDHYRMRREQVPLDFELESDDRTESDRLDFTPVVRKFAATLPPQYRRPLIRHDLHGETMEEGSSRNRVGSA
ncbi:MAG: hypothetical protein HS122_08090 [Opitutaceae bacterium]|nr:hypothetical protein [Opitutaceae bacterium]